MRRPKRALIDVDSLLNSEQNPRPIPPAPVHRHTEFVITGSGLSAARSYHTAQIETPNTPTHPPSESNDDDTSVADLHMIEPEEPEEDGTTVRLISRRRTIGVCSITYAHRFERE